MMAFDSKAQEASLLMPRLHQAVLSFEEVSAQRIVDRLHDLYPTVAVATILGVGIYMWYRDGEEYRPTPKSMHFAALRIEAVRKDGSAKVVKDRVGVQQATILSQTTCPKHLLQRLYPCLNRKTWHEHLLDDVF